MLWHKVIGSKHGMEGGWWPCEAGNTTFRRPWKAIQLLDFGRMFGEIVNLSK